MADFDNGINMNNDVDDSPDINSNISSGIDISSSRDISENIVGVFSATGDVIGSNLKNRLPTIIIGSLTLMSGIAWNNGLKALIDQYVPPEYSASKNVKVKFIYAFLLTIIIIIIISFLVKYFS